MRKNANKKLIIYHTMMQLILFFVAIFLTVMVSTNSSFISKIDDFVFYLASFVRNSVVNNIFLFITLLGETTAVIIVLVLLLFSKNRKSYVPLYYLVLISVCTNYIIKNLVLRPRPVGQFAENLILNYSFPSSYSFPSGHSQTSLVLYFVLAYLFANYAYSGKHKKLILAFGILLPVLIMISRIILGVHFFSDVLMGATIGTIIITNFIFLEKYNKNNNI